MSHAERDRKDDSNSQPAVPELGAILPGEPLPTPSEIFGSMDDYQKRIQSEWETAKNTYEKKINQIMEEFLNQKLLSTLGPDDPTLGAYSEADAKKKRAEESKPYVAPSSNNERLEDIIARVEKTLQMADRETGLFSGFGRRRPSIINASWFPLRQRLSRLMGPFLFIATVSAAAAYFIFAPITFPTQTSLPYTHVAGPVFADGKVYLVDWFRKTLYVHSARRGMPIVSVETMPNNFVTGLAISNSYIWTADGLGRSILQHATTPDHRVSLKVDSPGAKPVGLFWDGNSLWSADAETKTLYRHQGNDIEIVNDQYAVPEAGITAFVLKENRVWLLDGKSRRINVYRLEDPLRLLATFDLDPFLKGANPVGITMNNDDLWVSTEDPPALIRVSRRRLERAGRTGY